MKIKHTKKRTRYETRYEIRRSLGTGQAISVENRNIVYQTEPNNKNDTIIIQRTDRVIWNCFVYLWFVHSVFYRPIETTSDLYVNRFDKPTNTLNEWAVSWTSIEYKDGYTFRSLSNCSCFCCWCIHIESNIIRSFNRSDGYNIFSSSSNQREIAVWILCSFVDQTNLNVNKSNLWIVRVQHLWFIWISFFFYRIHRILKLNKKESKVSKRYFFQRKVHPNFDSVRNKNERD